MIALFLIIFLAVMAALVANRRWQNPELWAKERARKSRNNMLFLPVLVVLVLLMYWGAIHL